MHCPLMPLAFLNSSSISYKKVRMTEVSMGHTRYFVLVSLTSMDGILAAPGLMQMRTGLHILHPVSFHLPVSYSLLWLMMHYASLKLHSHWWQLWTKIKHPLHQDVSQDPSFSVKINQYMTTIDNFFFFLCLLLSEPWHCSPRLPGSGPQ